MHSHTYVRRKDSTAAKANLATLLRVCAPLLVEAHPDEYVQADRREWQQERTGPRWGDEETM